MTPKEKYATDLLRDDFFADAAQALAIEKLQALFDALVASNSGSSSKFHRVFHRTLKKQRHTIKGLYFWGGVGRGKTYLMDCFYDVLPFAAKERLHFHRFMQKTHQDLSALQGEKNPLDIIAAKIAKRVRVICFDEFFVTDITDAMILGKLFEQLFDYGVVLVATSNIIPDKLYENGLQRARFLPAIAAIKTHCDVVNVDSGEDYRLRTLKQAALFYSPLSSEASERLEQSWQALTQGHEQPQTAIVINNRDIPLKRLADDVIWFSFDALCGGPWSQNDYIEIARLFNTVILSDVPVLGMAAEDQARRFINLIDEFYDRQVNLMISAEAQIETIYQGNQLKFEMQRTQSRLLEMQSEEYLAKPHRP